LANDPRGEADRKRSNLGAQRHECRLTLRLDRCLSSRSDACRLSSCLLLELGKNLRAIEASLLANLRSLATCIGKLSTVALESGIRLSLGDRGRLDLTLDRRRTLIEHRLDLRQRV